jgi:hypothetical protein
MSFKQFIPEIAVRAQRPYVPKVGHRVRTVRGVDIHGVVQKLAGGKVVFKSDDGRVFRAHAANVMRHEESPATMEHYMPPQQYQQDVVANTNHLLTGLNAYDYVKVLVGKHTGRVFRVEQVTPNEVVLVDEDKLKSSPTHTHIIPYSECVYRATPSQVAKVDPPLDRGQPLAPIDWKGTNDILTLKDITPLVTEKEQWSSGEESPRAIDKPTPNIVSAMMKVKGYQSIAENNDLKVVQDALRAQEKKAAFRKAIWNHIKGNKAESEKHFDRFDALKKK